MPYTKDAYHCRRCKDHNYLIECKCPNKDITTRRFGRWHRLMEYAPRHSRIRDLNDANCRKCGIKLVVGKTWGAGHRRADYICLICNRVEDKRWKDANKEKVCISRKKAFQKLKLAVMSYYSRGTPKCTMCGYTDTRALSIDHVDGGGREHLRTVVGGDNHFYRWLKHNGFPKGFQVLCMNCQWIKRHMYNEHNQWKYKKEKELLR